VSFGSVCAWLLGATVRNLAVQQARRLRRARYAVPGAFAVLYLWLVLRSNPFASMPERFPWVSTLAAHAESILTVLLAAGALAGWVFGKPKPRLVFTEAEIHFLFAAPVTRRSVVHYRLVKAILLSGVMAAFLTLLFGRAAGGSAAALGVAVWVALSTLELHLIGASFARASLHERVEGIRLRAVQLTAFGVAGAFVLAARSTLGAQGPAAWLLWPARAVIRPITAQGPGPYVSALLLGGLVLAAHYVWVLVAADRFEDDAVETAERAARHLEALRTGGATAIVVTGKKRSVPFRLPRCASPEIAIAWKGIIAVTRSLVIRMVAIIAPLSIAVVVGMFWLVPTERIPAAAASGFIAAAVLLILAMMGPAFTGGGVTGDLTRLDFLRALPLSGGRIVLGQALAPAMLLSAVWVILVPVASFLLPLQLAGFERGCVGLALIIVGPPMLLLGVLLQAAVVLLVPGWTIAGPGPLAFGRMMLASVVQFIGFPILALPAGLVAALGIAVGRPIVGWSAVPASGVLVALALALEIALALLIVGRLFEKLDPSDL
jgi:ABC-2 type transport system permease protein